MKNLNIVRARLIKRFAKVEAQRQDKLARAVRFLEAAVCGDDQECKRVLESMTCECGGACPRCAKESKGVWGMDDGGAGYEEGGKGSNQYKSKPGGKSRFAPEHHEPDEPIRVESPKTRAARIRKMKVDPVRARVIKRALGQKAVEATLFKDGARGEISDLLKDAEGGYSFAGKPAGMDRGDGLYEADPRVAVTNNARRKKSHAPITSVEPVDRGGSEKEEANYRYASDPARSCGRCAHFREPAGCELVAGMILKTNTCDWWESREKAMKLSERAIRRFNAGYNSRG